MRIPRNYDDLVSEIKSDRYSLDLHTAFYRTYDAYTEKKRIIHSLFMECNTLSTQIKEHKETKLASTWEAQVRKLENDVKAVDDIFPWAKVNAQYQNVAESATNKKPILNHAIAAFEETALFIISKATMMGPKFDSQIKNVTRSLESQRENIKQVVSQKIENIDNLRRDLANAQSQIARMEQEIREMKEKIEHMRSETASPTKYTLTTFGGTIGF